MNDGKTKITFDEVEIRLMFRAIRMVRIIDGEDEQQAILKKLTKGYARITDGRYLCGDACLAWEQTDVATMRGE